MKGCARHPSNAYIRNIEFLRRSHCFPFTVCLSGTHLGTGFRYNSELTTTSDTHIAYMQGTTKERE